MTESVLTRMVGCETTAQIWDRINVFFAYQSKAKIKQLKTTLKTTRKESSSMNEYLLKVKSSFDALAAIGSPISLSDQLDYVFDGLSEDYDSFITSISTRLEPYTMAEVEALLMAQETRT
ncbi:hypothetical protein QN277_021212 [Acacia crassicarpa]|uniref:Uncharacterized protein n=1 Tax=Acacia crassicarpa TaxID=499986 RepID=A0AAE1MP87_9FABA|nr:hypothetical protein QN277_021212 [Acacia crassicarpa]